MTDQSFTQLHAEHGNDMPGIRDFLVEIPFCRAGLTGDETTALRVRIPAADDQTAIMIAVGIAEHVGTANRPDAGAQWRPMIGHLTATDVEGTDSPAELAAQVRHWQKIVAAVAAKYPTMVQVSADEYNTADPNSLALVPMGDSTMMFAIKDSLEKIQAGTALASTLFDLPDIVAVPDSYGGHRDPDVRGVKVQTLPVFPHDKVEIVADGSWMLVADVTINNDLSISVTASAADQDGYRVIRFFDLDALAVVRPATVESFASDLPSAAMHGRQVLAGDGWWTVAEADYTGPTGDAYNVLLVKDPQQRSSLGGVVLTGDEQHRSTSFTAHEKVLLRQQPDSWWT